MKSLKRILSLFICAAITLSLSATAFARDKVNIRLDNAYIWGDVSPEIKNDRTMVPIRMVSERLGADVAWDAAERKITLTRAGVTVVMTLDSTSAYVDGKHIVMDVAPYIKDDRTMIPLRYVSEFFGQIVSWDSKESCAYIDEDKSVVGDSNLEAWALAMGSYLSYSNGGSPKLFGMSRRGSIESISSNPSLKYWVEIVRFKLSDGWSIYNREDLVTTILRMTYAGHNTSFLTKAEQINALTEAQYKSVLANATGVNAYMIPQTKAISEKWGERGILCWDLFRMGNLVQWGYVAGYISYAEALALIEPAADLLKEYFSSWDEAIENYLDGYSWWSRTDMTGKDIWTEPRGIKYQKILSSYPDLFDDAMFTSDIIPVPGLKSYDILGSL